jgi:Uma2 family endonuclease
MSDRPIMLGPEFDHLEDDFDERIHGDSAHADAMTALVDSLRRVARRRALPWFVNWQVFLTIGPGRNPFPYQPRPDVFVYPALPEPPRDVLVLERDGPPALVIQVTSPATSPAHDRSTLSPDGELGAYAVIGVPEYLVFDPGGTLIPGRVRAWQTGPGGRYAPWEPEGDGRWHSAALSISFAPDGLLLRVYNEDGQPVPTALELAEVIEERQRRIVALQDELRRARGESGS